MKDERCKVYLAYAFNDDSEEILIGVYETRDSAQNALCKMKKKYMLLDPHVEMTRIGIPLVDPSSAFGPAVDWEVL